jgi:homeobox protein cut-like
MGGAGGGDESAAAGAAAAAAAAGSALSPLQRMASITNSLVSHPHLPNSGSGGYPSRPKPCLPPITQQQFDKFQHLNTDETVRKVSDIIGTEPIPCRYRRRQQ